MVRICFLSVSDQLTYNGLFICQSCGGGPKASLWYLRSMSLAAPLAVAGSSTHQVLFHDDQVI